jgi:hypothetical protein
LLSSKGKHAGMCELIRLQVDGLTHLNFAFAFLDPSTFQITTMDAATLASLF